MLGSACMARSSGKLNRAIVGRRATTPFVAPAVDPARRPSIRRVVRRARAGLRTLARMHRVTLRESSRAWFSQGNRPAGPVWLHHVWTLAFSAFVAAILTVFAIAFGHPGDAPSIAMWWHTFRAYAVV